MKSLLTLLLTTVFLNFTHAQNNWAIDGSHSTIEFEVSHLTVSSVSGYFTSFDGTIETSSNDDFNGAKVNTNIKVESITTNNLERDKHLKEDDFFNAAKYPEISFSSTSFKKDSDGSYTMMGDLTIRDVTKRVKLDVDFGGIVSLNGTTRAGFTAEGMINRFDFGLKWDDALDSGGLIVGEKVKIILKIAAVQK